MESEFTHMGTRELHTLLRHHTRMANAISERLSEMDAWESQPAPVRSEPTSDESDLRDAIAPVLVRASAKTKRNLVELVESVAADLPNIHEPIPERSRSGKPPRYVRLVAEGKTFAYVQVRRESLRVDVAVPRARANEIPGGRQRDVRDDNMFQISVFVNSPSELVAARDAIKFAYHLQHEEVVQA